MDQIHLNRVTDLILTACRMEAHRLELKKQEHEKMRRKGKEFGVCVCMCAPSVGRRRNSNEIDSNMIVYIHADEI